MNPAWKTGIIGIMPVYRISPDTIEALPETSFQAQGIRERADLQRLLRANIGVVAPNVLVIAEEFAEWTDSKRRIDLLGVDDKANLVVFELKRSDDGGHMELQAIRYAAMVSTMTFARAAEFFQSYLDRQKPGQDARATLLHFLGWEEPREDDFASDTRIILVSAEFSKELTTAVMWLNERDLDIRCVRLKPYANGSQTIIDVQQVVPLPEAEDRTIQIKQKEHAQRTEKAERHSERKAFWTAALPLVSRTCPRWQKISPSDDVFLNATSGKPGVSFHIWSYINQCGSSLYLDGGTSRPLWAKAVFDALLAKRDDIERALGAPLIWDRLDEKRASFIATKSITGGYRSPRAEWPSMHDAMAQEAARFEAVMLAHIDAAITTANAAK